MSMIANKGAVARIIDWQTPPANIDDPVRESRVPRCGCRACGQIGMRHQIGKSCSCCSGTMEVLPASAWRWCRACGGRGPCCDTCGWHGVMLATKEC